MATLFSNYFLAREVALRLQNQRVPEEVRQAALRMVLARGDNAGRLAEETWRVVRSPGADEDEYARAMDRAEAAVAIDPENCFCAVALGAAQFRRGFLDAAHQTLRRASELEGDDARARMAIYCFLAMTQHSLGRTDEAEQAMGELPRLLAKGGLRAHQNEEIRALIAEASRVVGVEVL